MAMMIVIYGNPDDVEEFDRHYHHIHVPLAKKIPGLKMFEMSQGPINSPMGFSNAYMIAMLHFDDMAMLQAGLSSPEGQAAAMDAEKLMAPGSGMLIFDNEKA